MIDKEKKSPALEVAKDRASEGMQERVLSTGVRVRLGSVSATLIEEVSSRIPYPDVPMWHNEAKERDEPNPGDPKYLDEVAQVDRDRGIAAMDAMILFGVELLDGVPDDDTWVTKLRFLEKRNMLDLGEYDFQDEMDREFLFKRYVAIGAADLDLVGEMIGVSEEAIAAAAESFPSPETPVPD